jgi:Na+/melibiose symporter-like transporter
VLVILLMTRRIADAPPETRPHLDVVGAVLSAIGLSLMVFGVLKSGTWGWILPKEGGPSWGGISPTIWLFVGGLLVVWLFFRWQARRINHGQEPLVDPTLFRNRQMTGGVTMFFFQFLMQAGLFFLIPLYLSVCLGLSALATGARLLPLSLTLLLAALGVPKVFPHISPRLVVRSGLFLLMAGTLVLLGALDVDSGASIVVVPLLLIGLGIGALASQLGSVTVSAVPDEKSPDVGGIQNTMTNLGASFGTALAGSLLFATLTSAFITNIQQSPDIPSRVKEKATVQLATGVPFISDADLNKALDESHLRSKTTDAALTAYQDARIKGLKAALGILAIMAALALFLAQWIPTRQPGDALRE